MRVTVVASVVAFGLLMAAVAVPVGAVAAPAAPSCRTLPVDADPVLRSDAAKAAFSVDGTGVKVGIISNSYNTNASNSTELDNIADGLLPGPGNPCGRLEPVHVLIPEFTDVEDDEGRAMAQMVHGVAPGASLYFATAGADLDGMSTAITTLVDAGVDIIIDDVILDSEPFFQESPISQQTVRDAGITYLSAAGNNTAVAQRPLAGDGITPIGAWSTAAYRPAACPTVAADASLNAAIQQAANGALSIDCLDFDPGDGVDVVSTFSTIPAVFAESLTQATASLPVMFQWGEPSGSDVARFEMFVTFDGQGPQQLGDPEPSEPLRYSDLTIDLAGHLNPDPNDNLVGMDITIVRYLNGPDAGAHPMPVGFAFIANGSQWAVDAEWWQSQGADTVGRSIVGHNGAPAAITVAATGAFDEDRIEKFSSLGPVTYYLSPDGAVLEQPITVSKPDILSVDGSRQTVLSQSGPETAPGVWEFDGTSSATPTAAGVVALALDLDPGLTPNEIAALLASTATPQPSPYVTIPADASVGAGLINALALLDAIAADLPAPAPNTPADPAGEGAAALAQSGLSETAAGAAFGAFTLGAGMLLLGMVLALRRRSSSAR